jgi:[acyl-carrier-protein] S-malonyltransferase
MKFTPESVAVLIPGQGCQFPGMGEHVYETSDRAKEIFYIGSEVLGQDLAEVCFGSDTDKLKDTRLAQPAIAAVSLANYFTAFERGFKPDVGIGHSAGEIPVLAAAGTLEVEEAFALLKARAEITHEASQERPGLMALVAGLRRDELKMHLGELLGGSRMSVANFNSTTQHVLTGDSDPIRAAVEKIKSIKVRERLKNVGSFVLDIAGAYHSKYHMEHAVEPLREKAKEFSFSQPDYLIMLNNAKYLHEVGTDNLPDYLANQLVKHVDFTGSIAKLYRDGLRKIIEIGPKPVHAKSISSDYPELQPEFVTVLAV